MNVQSAINAGLLVQFVATNWNKGSNTNDLAGSVINTPPNAVVPGGDYKVLRTIYANDVTTDINTTNPGPLGWKTFAIVAQHTTNPLDIVIAIRGTLTVWEWVQDAKFLLKPFSHVSGGGLTEDGFTDMYYSFSFTPANPTGTFLKDLAGVIPAKASITVTGHSLGAGVATLLALDLAANTTFPITLYTLASPRVGDLTFSHVFNHVVPNAYRVANRLDIVPKVPPPLMYFHVGDETELVPPGNLKFDLGCEHHLTSYFDMLGALIAQQATYPIQADCLKGAPTIAPPTENAV